MSDKIEWLYLGVIVLLCLAIIVVKADKSVNPPIASKSSCILTIPVNSKVAIPKGSYAGASGIVTALDCAEQTYIVKVTDVADNFGVDGTYIPVNYTNLILVSK